MAAVPRNRPGVGRLAAELTSFVGRGDEIAQVRQLLATARLVTLTGPGGAGKTRLAVRVAADVRRAFADGVWQVDLAAVRDPALLGYAVVEALDVDDQTGRPVSEVLVDYLCGRELLLLLDNCEHVLQACAGLVGVLLRAAAGLRVLATSRQPLGIFGEHLVVVSPLPVPAPGRLLQAGAAVRYPAVALFVERAAAVHPGFRLTPDNEAVVVQVCRDLDGLPLAIELAAVRLRSLSLEQLAAALSDRMRLLRFRHAEPAHHQTLRATFDWSFALCTRVEQAMWAALAVFVDSVDLPAAEAVCGALLPVEQIATALVGLIDKSVLVARVGSTGSVRYRLLETVREYGLARLHERPAGEEATLRRRHRDYYLQLAEQGETGWSGPEQEDVYFGLRREHPNLRGALDFCLTAPGEARTGLHLAGTLWFYWTGCGLLREGRYWLDRFLAADTESSPQRTKALWATGAVAVAEGDTDTTNRVLAQSWEQATAAGDERILGLTGLSLGMAALFADDYPRARDLFEEAVARFDALGETNPAALLGQAALAMIAAGQGDLDRAETICQQTQTACARRGDRWTTGWVCYVLALLALARGEINTAIGHAREGLRHMVVFHNLTGIAMLSELYATVLLAAGEAEQSAVVHGAAEQIWQIMGRRLFGSAALDAQHQQCEAQARRLLGDDAYEAAHARGARLDVNEAVDYALGTPTPATPSRMTPAPAVVPPLTPREWEVANLVGQGLTNQQIAARLVTSRRTVESHVENILRKLGFTSRTQVAVWIARQRRQP